MSFWSRLFGVKSVPQGMMSEIPVLNTALGWHPHGDYGAIYRKQPAVRTVVDFLSKNVAQLSIKVYLRVGNDDRVEVGDHELARLLRFPNPDTTAYRHIRDTVADIAIYDRAYWQKLRIGRVPRALLRISPANLSVEVDNRTLRRTYRWMPTGEVLSREDLVIFSGYSPDGSTDGVSPLETLRRVLAEEWAAQNHRENFWKNAARQGGVIERPPVSVSGDWNDVARERFRKDWQSSMAGGANAGKTAVLEDGMTWNPSSFSPKDSEYIEGRKLTFLEVARAYAPSLPGLMSEEAKSNIEAYHRQLYQDVLAPITRSIEDEIEVQLLPEFDILRPRRDPIYVEFNLAEKLRGSFEEQARTLVTAVGVPYLGVNEARAMLNRPRIDDRALDEPVKPMNVMYGGQPAVTVPTEDPGTSLRAQNFSDLSTKLSEFFDRQGESIVSALGGLEDHGALSVTTVWKDKRWNRELARIYVKAMPLDDAERTAEYLNSLHRDQIASRFAKGGLDAVRGVFADAKAAVDEHAFLRI